MAGVRPARSLIIPMRDEADRIGATLARLAASSLAGPDLEVVLVDDGSVDRTVVVATSCLAELPSLCGRVEQLGRRRGKGAAVRAGMAAATGAHRVFVDADLPVDDEDVEACFAVLESGRADLVVADRSHPGSRITRPQPRGRTIVSRAFNGLVRTLRLHPSRDSQCGLKGTTAAATDTAFAAGRIDGLAFDVEVLVRAVDAGLRVEAVPVTWRHVDPPGRRSVRAAGLRAAVDVVGIWARRGRERPVPRRAPAHPWVRVLRPRQWLKNLLVLAGPAAGAVLDDGAFLRRGSLMFVSFCAAASAGYCWNDAADATTDRHHPVKSRRPVASGELDARVVTLVGAVLAAGALGVAAVAGGWPPVAVIAAYLALSAAYTTVLRSVPYVEMATVAGGFVLRAVAALVGTDVRPSGWFLLVSSTGALYVVAAKRRAERQLADAHRHRPVLAREGAVALQRVQQAAGVAAFACYALWSLNRAELSSHLVPWFQLSCLPFGAALIRFGLAFEEVAEPTPEDVVLGDRPLQVVIAVWAAMLAIGIYAG